MKSYDGYLQEEIIRNGNNKFLTNYRFCPKCFKEDKIPYFKKEHRVIFSTFCEKHKCYLLDKCQECRTPISLFKMFNNELVYEFCFKCGFKLVNSRINYLNEALILATYICNTDPSNDSVLPIDYKKITFSKLEIDRKYQWLVSFLSVVRAEARVLLDSHSELKILFQRYDNECVPEILNFLTFSTIRS